MILKTHRGFNSMMAVAAARETGVGVNCWNDFDKPISR
jgi:hypothetical protein